MLLDEEKYAVDDQNENDEELIKQVKEKYLEKKLQRQETKDQIIRYASLFDNFIGQDNDDQEQSEKHQMFHNQLSNQLNLTPA